MKGDKFKEVLFIKETGIITKEEFEEKKKEFLQKL